MTQIRELPTNRHQNQRNLQKLQTTSEIEAKPNIFGPTNCAVLATPITLNNPATT